MDLKALEQSLVLGAAGMTVIFIFMGGLIAFIHFYIKVATRFFPDRKKETQAETHEPESDGQGEVATAVEVASAVEVAAAVAVAVRENGA